MQAHERHLADRDKSKADLTSGLSCAGGLGSAAHVTACFAFLAVSHVLRRLAHTRTEPR